MWFRKYETKGHPKVWAVISVIAFPVVLLAAQGLGAPGLWPIVWAASATLLVLLCEVMARGRLWISEPNLAEFISHPETPIRLLIFSGAILLILETALIFLVATNRRMDDGLIGLVMRKQCSAEYDKTARSLCGYLQAPRDALGRILFQNDLAAYALRAETAKQWFANESLVTCAQRKIDQLATSEFDLYYAGLIHCAAWQIDQAGQLQVKTEKTGFAGIWLTKDANGFYAAGKWTDNPNSDQWSETLKSMAESAKTRIQSLSISSEFKQALRAETLKRARILVSKNQ